MPSDKKRVNLTVPDEVYDKLQNYKLTNGIPNDAGACLQLIVQQLKAQENTAVMMKALQNMSIEQLKKLSDEGLTHMKQELPKSGK